MEEMKRFFALLLAAVILALTPVTVFAQGFETYQLKDLRMTIDIPIAYHAVTRNTRENDPVYESFGMTKAEMDALLESTDTHLDSYNPNTGISIRVTGSATGIKDFNMLDDDDLDTVVPAVISQTTQMGLVPQSAELYQHQQVLFVKLYSKKMELGKWAPVLSYITVVDGKRIDIILSSENGEIAEIDETRFKNIIDLIHFDRAAVATPGSVLLGGIMLWGQIGFALLAAFLLAFPTILARLIWKNKEGSLKKRRIFMFIYIPCAALALAFIVFVMKVRGAVFYGGIIYMIFLAILAMIRKKKAERAAELEREKIEEEQARPFACPSCGAELVGTHLYCPKCGAKIKHPEG